MTPHKPFGWSDPIPAHLNPENGPTGQPGPSGAILEGKHNPGSETWAGPCPTCDRNGVPSGAFTVAGLERHFLRVHYGRR